MAAPHPEMVTPLSSNATVPVAPEPVTDAVRVTVLVVKAGFRLEETVVVAGVVVPYVTVISHELMDTGVVVSPSPSCMVSVHSSPLLIPVPIKRPVPGAGRVALPSV